MLHGPYCMVSVVPAACCITDTPSQLWSLLGLHCSDLHILPSGSMNERRQAEDLELYYRAIVTQTAWHWHQNRLIHQWYRIKDTASNPHNYSYLIWDQGTKNEHWRKDSLFDKWCCENWKSICHKMTLNPYLSPWRKLNAKWIKIKQRLYLLEEKVGRILHHVGLSPSFPHKTLIVEQLKSNKRDGLN